MHRSIMDIMKIIIIITGISAITHSIASTTTLEMVEEVVESVLAEVSKRLNQSQVVQGWPDISRWFHLILAFLKVQSLHPALWTLAAKTLGLFV